MDRRRFVTRLSGAALAPAVLPGFLPEAIRRLGESTAVAHSRGAPLPLTGMPDAYAESLAADEDFWEPIQRAFDVDRTLTNLNNGGVSPTPTHVLDAMIRDLRFSNELPVRHMWQILEPRIEVARRDLAREFGCDIEEMAITRNASESMETLIFGLDLKRGDEVIVSNQNYPRMLTAWRQRERRDGIVLRSISFPVPPPSQQVIVDAVAAAITPRTRVIELPHITNLSGQILPIRAITELARPRDIAVLVDGAHAFAHFPFTRDELGCDYYGTSLHKWLYAPIGTGFLYVRKSKQKAMWPLMAADPELDEDIRKYEQIGTHPAANHNAIPIALADSVWAKYKLGEFFKIDDPETHAPAVRNPYYLKMIDPFQPDMALQKLIDRGVKVAACDMAIAFYSGLAAKQMGLQHEAVMKEWSSAVLPGIFHAPSGLVACQGAATHGCTYLFAG